jgi:hypothetical protein
VGRDRRHHRGRVRAAAAAGLVISGSLTNALRAAGVAFPNPFGVFPRHGWYSDVIGAMALVALAAAVLALVSVFMRRRRASAELRQQLAWLAYVGVLTGLFALLSTVYSLVTGGGDSWVGTVLFVLLYGTPVFGIPLACAVAVLRYQLYDLDIVVKKTVVAAVVAAVFTAVDVLVVVVVGAATGQPGGNPLTFVAAVLAAVLLQPVRTRAGRLADRLVYGTRATPYEVLSEFSEHMAGTYSAEDVLPRMARMLAEATGAQRAEVWLRTSGREHLEAAWPSPNGPAPAQPGPAPAQAVLPPAVAAETPAASAGPGARAFVVEHQGERLGALRITLQLARQMMADSPDEAAGLLAQTEQAAQDALEDLRDLARGIYPPLLADLGLPAALEAQANKAPLPVTVQAPGVGRYAQDVEAALYFCVLEALQDVAKYAHASAACVTLGYDGYCLAFAVTDDGGGFDQSAAPAGSGVQGMADRLAALGGTLRVSSAPGHGTEVTGRVPTVPRLSSRRRNSPAGPLPAGRWVAEAELHLAERDPVAGPHQEAGTNLPPVRTGPVGRAEVGEHPVVADAPQFGVAPRHRHVGQRQVGVAGAADREHRPEPAARQHQARKAHGPPRGAQPPGEPIPRRRCPVAQAEAAPGRLQVAQQAGELPRVPRLQREVQPVQEGVMRQAAVGGPFPEHFDHFVAVRVGHPERRPLRVQGRHIKTITPVCVTPPELRFRDHWTFPRMGDAIS